jgi:hypothetical protein
MPRQQRESAFGDHRFDYGSFGYGVDPNTTGGNTRRPKARVRLNCDDRGFGFRGWFGQIQDYLSRAAASRDCYQAGDDEN